MKRGSIKTSGSLITNFALSGGYGISASPDKGNGRSLIGEDATAEMNELEKLTFTRARYTAQY